MIPLRSTILSRVRAPFWSAQPLSSGARRVVLIIVAVVLIVDSLLRTTSSAETPLLGAIVGTSLIIVVALFAWKPPVAAVALIVGMTVAALFNVASVYLIGMVLVVGLVSATCSPALTALYIAAVTTWTIAEGVRPGGVITPAGVAIILLLGLASLFMGITIRQQYGRWLALSEQVAANERELAEQLRRERDLIADELHDIVAHEITIVALHAAVLERTEDVDTRSLSQAAIREAAVQALTDIRRVLGMVRGEENMTGEQVAAPDTLDDALDDVLKDLAMAGIAVSVDVPDELRLPNASLLALIRVIRESATNVLKHATGARHVRIALTVQHGWARLEFADDSPLSHTAGLPTSGYGIMRLRERFRVFGGTFDAARRGDGWVVSASLPLSA